ncbi:MAG: peptidoglycan endopeptidase [Candidatus Omnitrophota bacterium]
MWYNNSVGKKFILLKIVPAILLFLIPSFMSIKRLNQSWAKVNFTQYATAKIPTPVWNTPTFPFFVVDKKGGVVFNDPGYINELEFIALPRTVFRVKNVLALKDSLIYQVTTDDYQYHTRRGFFIDSRFVENEYEKQPQERPKILLPQKTIIENLVATRGSIYTWGGNYHNGIPQIFSFYQPPFDLTDNSGLKNRWMLKGVDCSGLLYEATNGYTPRNTIALLDFGMPVPIAGLSIKQISENLKPLDIIVWPGHVIVVLNRNQAIESRPYYQTGKIKYPGGVRVRQIKKVLSEVSKSRVPVNSYTDFGTMGKGKFVIRRWYGQKLSGNIPTGT